MSAKPEDIAQAPDPAEMARILAEVASRSSSMMADFLKRHPTENGVTFKDELGIAKAYMDLWSRMLANPYQLAQAQMNMFWDYTRLMHGTWLKMLGHEVEPVAAPAKSDPRFKDEEWENHFLFDFVKQSYLIAARHIHEAVSATEGLAADSKKKVDFFTRQYIDALSPSNFALTNPQVLREIWKTGGTNLVKGLNNLLQDLEEGNGQLRIKIGRAHV